MDIEISGEGAKLSEAEIEAAEKELGRQIPPAYRELLLHHNGGFPDRSEFEVDGKPVSVKAFLGIGGPDDTLDIDYVLETFGDRMPTNLFPIARDPGGNLITIGTEGPQAGKVFFWDHEREADDGEPPTDQNLKLIAETFDDFLRKLS